MQKVRPTFKFIKQTTQACLFDPRKERADPNPLAWYARVTIASQLRPFALSLLTEKWVINILDIHWVTCSHSTQTK